MSSTARAVRLVRRTLTHNVGLKLLSIVAAVTLFSLVHGAEDAQKSVFVEVLAQAPPPAADRMLVSELPEQIKVTLRGSRSLLDAIEADDLGPITIDVRDTSLSYYYIEPETLDVPAGATIVQVAPASIPLSWAERVERRLPVKPELGEAPGGDLQVEVVHVEPRTVSLNGPRNELEALEAVRTLPLRVESLGIGRHVVRSSLEAPPAHTTASGREAEVTVEVSIKREERALGLFTVEVEGRRARARPEQVHVSLWGPAGTVRGLDPGLVRATVFVDEVAVGMHDMPVIVQGLPEGVEAVTTPTSVKVSVAVPTEEEP